jgi:predicted Rossmann fold nucleotide-binding protein DprA/Smf involved in DNA uptake
MPKHDSDLFERLRRAGVRKQVAKTLSELSEDAGKKAVGAGHAAIAELRALADEIEKRLPGTQSAPKTRDRSAPAAAPAKAPATARAKAPATVTRRRRVTPSPTSPTPRTPRGANKAKILASLKTGPRTASEVSQTTGISTGTVSATLTKMARTGEVTKATRGYALPK